MAASNKETGNPYETKGGATTKNATAGNAVPGGATSGEALRADTSKIHGDEKDGPFWYGALASLPVGVVSIGGVTFMQIVEDVHYSEEEQDTKRSPYIGVVGTLLKSQIEAVRRELPRMIVRFHGPERDAEDSHEEVKNLGHASKRGVRSGYIIRIPTEEEKEKLIAADRFKPHIPGPHDEPLADHIYLVRRDARSQNFPPSLGETGLEV